MTRAELRDRFEKNLEVGWDYAVNGLHKDIVRNDIYETINIDTGKKVYTDVSQLVAHMDTYITGYEMDHNGDIDDGDCYKFRSVAIHMIQKELNKPIKEN